MKKPPEVIQPRWRVFILLKKAERLPFTVTGLMPADMTLGGRGPARRTVRSRPHHIWEERKNDTATNRIGRKVESSNARKERRTATA
jgi:hypothetical protein